MITDLPYFRNHYFTIAEEKGQVFALFFQKGLPFLRQFDYNKEDIVQI